MPWKPPTRCSTPGCPNLIPAGRGGLCTDHRRTKQQTRKQRESWRDYNSPEWKRNRATVLRLEPLCRICGDEATVVDHITPLQRGGTHDLANLRPLCKRCHDRHTWTQTLGKKRRRR